MTISIYRNINDTKSTATTLIDQFIADVKNGTWKEPVEKIRETQDAELKKTVPLVTVSGQFKERNANGLIAHSGFICIDIDNIEPVNMLDVANKLWSDPYTYACFKSIRGNGLAVIVKIDPAKHLDAFEGLEKYYSQQYQIGIDRSCKDVSRTRFVSYDPGLFFNNRSQIFKKYIPKKEQPKLTHPDFVASSDFEYIIDQIVSNRIDLTQGQYYLWRNIGFALCDYFGEDGRGYFHLVSQFNEKYDEKNCDKHYTAFLKSGGQGIRLGTFMYYCKEAGINITSPRTKRTLQAVYHAKKQGRPKESVIRVMTELDGMDINEATELVNRAFENTSTINTDKNFSQIDTIEIFINSNYKLQRNLITNRLENNGEVFTETEENSMYIALKKIEPKIPQQLLSTYLRSHEIPSYNPLIEFLRANEHRQPVGVIKSMADTITGYNGHLPNGEVMYDYIEVFLTKFYLGLIAGALGDETPPLIPIIYGEKIGTGKTQFWKKLLPKELSNYFAVSDLSGGKDDDILLSMKWIVCDDEWGGKLATNYKYMKAKSGQTSSTIRRAYGKDHEDIKRLAMLCGTSNDTDIITDSSNRRIVPIHASSIDLETYYAIDKTDALIEAYHRYTSGGESPFLNSYENEMLQLISSNNTAPDVNEELLSKYYEVCEPEDPNGITMTASDISTFLQSKTQLRISNVVLGKALNRLKFLKIIERRNSQPRTTYLVRPVLSQNE